MNDVAAVSVRGFRRPVPAIQDRGRFFYPAAACLMLLIMFAGFRHFYLHGQAYPGRELAPPIKTLVIFHGVSMSAWMLIFLAQSVLVTRKQFKVHITLGKLAAAFAVSIVVSGLMLSVQSTRIAPPDFVLWGMTGKQFMAVPFFGILLFAAMVGTAVWFRKRSEIHRPMMLFATLSALAAATARVDLISNLYQGTTWERIFGPFLSVLVLGAILVAARWALTRSFDRWFAISYGVVLLAFVMTMQVATTAAWVRSVDFMIR